MKSPTMKRAEYLGRIAWPDAKVAALRFLWDAGISAAEIGRRLGYTKSAVVGKAHRLCLTPRPSPIGRSQIKRTTPYKPPPKPHQPRIPTPRSVPMRPPPKPQITTPPPVELPALAMERGEPGVWRAPVSVRWETLCEVWWRITTEDGPRREALPQINRARVREGLPPLAVWG